MNMQTTDYKRIAKAIEFITASFPSNPDLKDIAAHVHLSEFHFQRLFSKWAGISPKKFQQFLALSYAKQCLNENFTIEEASQATGLSSTGRLHDLFVKIEGVTPGEYKSKGKGIEIVYGIHTSPFGDVFLALTPKGICRMVFTENLEEEIEVLTNEWKNAHIQPNQEKTGLVLEEIFSQSPTPIKIHIKGTPFQLKVWEALLKIPEGKLTSYGTIANAIGSPNATRAVGTAIGKKSNCVFNSMS